MSTLKEGTYELTFWGGIPTAYRRWWPSYDAAEKRALELLAELENRAAHPAIVYGPGLGPYGVTIR